MSNISGAFPSFSPPETQKHNKLTAKKSVDKDPVSEFLAYQKLSPEQKVRDSILKKYGLDEEGFSKLSGDAKKKIEDQVKAEMLLKTKNNLAEKGVLIDMTA
jgi:hypothetical protein